MRNQAHTRIKTGCYYTPSIWVDKIQELPKIQHIDTQTYHVLLEQMWI